MLKGIPFPHKPADDDRDLAEFFKGMSGTAMSEELYTDSQNRIVRNKLALTLSFQPSQPGVPGSEDRKSLTFSISGETGYDYSGTPEPILAPTGVFPGA